MYVAALYLILAIINKTVKMRDKNLKIAGFINFLMLNTNPSGATESHLLKSRHLENKVEKLVFCITL